MMSESAPPPTNGSPNTVYITQPWFDSSYLKSAPGIMKIAAIILNVLGFLFIVCSMFRSNGRGVYFIVVALVSLCFTCALLLSYAYHLVEKHHNLPWLKIEMITSVVLMFLYLIASTIAVAFGSAAYSTAGFFGYLAMVLYGAEAFLKVQSLKKGELAQGHTVTTKQITPMTIT